MTESQSNIQQTQTHSSHKKDAVHVMHPLILLAVWASLLVLTFITVAVTYVDLGDYNLLIAMAIASIKAVLVILFFMHMLYDRPFNALILIVALITVGIFIIFALLDTTQYQPFMIPDYAPGLER